jgi:hypothetical protein
VSARALGGSPAGAAVVVLPREDGQYSDHAPDVVALLEEAGVPATYATDPRTAGTYGQKTAETLLPPLLIVLSDAASVITVAQGIVHVVRWFLDGRPKGHKVVVVDVTFQRDEDGESRSVHVSADQMSVGELERVLREAGQLWKDQE